MLEFLGYALFLVLVVGCLLYVMSSLETEGAPTQHSKRDLP